MRTCQRAALVSIRYRTLLCRRFRNWITCTVLKLRVPFVSAFFVFVLGDPVWRRAAFDEPNESKTSARHRDHHAMWYEIISVTSSSLFSLLDVLGGRQRLIWDILCGIANWCGNTSFSFSELLLSGANLTGMRCNLTAKWWLTRNGRPSNQSINKWTDRFIPPINGGKGGKTKTSLSSLTERLPKPKSRNPAA